jgi:hypothetical protein
MTSRFIVAVVASVALASVSICFTSHVSAKLPPPPPPTPEQQAAAAAKAEKDKAAAEKTKADQARYEDKAVANFQGNMKKAGKPVPKPTPIVVAAPAAPPAAAAAAPVVPAKGAPAKAAPPKKS